MTGVVCSIHGKQCQGFPTPSPERLQQILDRCFFDIDGVHGPRGTMYVDGRAIYVPTELKEK